MTRLKKKLRKSETYFHYVMFLVKIIYLSIIKSVGNKATIIILCYVT